MTLPPEVRVLPGHTDETTIGREWEENPFVRVWRGVEAEAGEAVKVAGDEATLVVWSPDYDGNGKALVRFADGSERIVGGSRVERWRMSSFVVPEELDAYAAAHTSPPPALLERTGRRDEGDARVPADAHRPGRGRFLQTLVFATGATRILEIGTYSGYSALSMAGGLAEGGPSTRVSSPSSTPRSRGGTSRRARTPTGSPSTSARRSRRSHGSKARSTSSSSTRTSRLRRVLRGRAAATRPARPDRVRQHAPERARRLGAGRG